MAADSRSTHTDALETLGSLIGAGEQRDAIHLGVEPVIAGERLNPGERIAFFDGDTTTAFSEDPMSTGPAIGIVDPFLTKAVRKGERFWLVVLPRQITSLRHVWTHPSFAPAEFEQIPDATLVCGTIRAERIKAGCITPIKLDVADVSRLWIENYVVELNEEYETYYKSDYGADPLTYEELMEKAKGYVSDSGWGGYLVKAGMLEGVTTKEEFWHHFEIVTGIIVDEDKKGNFFSCSC